MGTPALTRVGMVLGGMCWAAIATTAPAQAVQFKKLLELGQAVPGDDQPVSDIIQPTIDGTGTVAVLVFTKTKVLSPNAPPQFRSAKTFKGIYRIAPGGQVSLVDGVSLTTGLGEYSVQSFSAPSISQGKVAFFSLRQTIRKTGTSVPGISLFVGTPGNVTKLFSDGPYAGNVRQSGRSNLAFVNGNAYFVDKLPTPPGSSQSQLAAYQFSNGQRRTLSTAVDASSALRASSQTILLRTGDVLSERQSNGQFTPIAIPNARKLGSCGFSVSLDDVAVCAEVGGFPDLLVRFGKQGSFKAIPFSKGPIKVQNPSISGTNVVFTLANANLSALLLSQNGQTAVELIRQGALLDQKPVQTLELSDNNRAIGGNSIVFVAKFFDGSQALYRADF